MIYSFEKTKEGYVLKIEGDLDLYSSYNIKEEVKSALISNPDNLVIDLAGLNYIDSAGIGLLIDLKKSAVQHNHNCEVKNVPADILSMFRSLRVDVILQIK